MLHIQWYEPYFYTCKTSLKSQIDINKCMWSPCHLWLSRYFYSNQMWQGYHFVRTKTIWTKKKIHILDSILQYFLHIHHWGLWDTNQWGSRAIINKVQGLKILYMLEVMGLASVRKTQKDKFTSVAATIISGRLACTSVLTASTSDQRCPLM